MSRVNASITTVRLSCAGRIEIVSAHEEKMHGLDALLRHLETNADGGFRQRMKDKTAQVAVVSVWRLKIESMTGKQGK